MAQRQMTIEQLVLSMFGALSLPPTEEEYQALGISKLEILKRRRFANVYGTLVLYLIKLSLPGAFPTYSSDLLETFDRYFQMAYQNSPTARERIEERLKKFQELTKIEEQEPFLDLALYITELFEHRPRKLAYAAKLNSRIRDMFLDFLTMGRETDIIEEG